MMLTMKNLFKKKGMIGKIAGVFMMILTLTACGAQPLPEQFDEETVKAEAQKAVDYFNDQDYQSIIDMGRFSGAQRRSFWAMSIRRRRNPSAGWSW